MPLPTGCDQHTVPRHGKIVNDKPAPAGRYRSASFVHQKISRGKVPVVAVSAGDGNVASALGHAGEAKREGAHPRHDGKGRSHRH